MWSSFSHIVPGNYCFFLELGISQGDICDQIHLASTPL